MGWEALAASLPALLSMYLTDIFINCRPKLPSIGALDTMNQALSSALLSARWNSGFCILFFLHTFS